MKKIFLLLILSIGVIPSVSASEYPVQATNNGLAKKVINYIFTDQGLAKHTTLEARIEAAKAANGMSELILQSIKDTWIAKDGFISDSEVKKLNTYMFNHYHDKMVTLHGDDEKGVETWFHKVVNNGGKMTWKIPVKRWYKKANRVADGIFHLGLYKTVNKRKILNEDWNKNVRWRLISRSLYVMYKDDLNLKHWSKKAYYKSLKNKR